MNQKEDFETDSVIINPRTGEYIFGDSSRYAREDGKAS